jgi:hypothetical protein
LLHYHPLLPPVNQNTTPPPIHYDGQAHQETSLSRSSLHDPSRRGTSIVQNGSIITIYHATAHISTLQEPTTDSFTVFPNLPAEIRLKVWRKASDRSVIIDLWTEYRKCEITNAIFYHQYYGTKLADTYSRVLQTNRESRDEVSMHS